MHLTYLLIFCVLVQTSKGSLNVQDIIHLAETKKLGIPCVKLIAGVLDKKEWALRMIDASSKIPTGIFGGNIMDLGNYDECVDIEHPADDESIVGKYCGMSVTVMINPNELDFSGQKLYLNGTGSKSSRDLTSIPLLLSICLPDTCSPKEFQTLADALLEDIKGVNVTFSDDMCQTKNHFELDGYDTFAIVFCAILLALVVISTSYDVFMTNLEKKPHHIILIAFSFFTNGKKLIATSRSPDQLLCLNGIRFFSILWVIAGHRFASVQAMPVYNRLFVENWRSEVYSQYIQGAPLAVDTFLCISGVVLSYAFLKNQRKPNSRFNVIMFYVHRYLRLTPVVGAAFLLAISLLKYFGSGPFWNLMNSFLKDNCLKWWWTYFLYVQNYVNMNEICLIHTWYLSMDMQMFLISPLILIPLVKYTKPTMYALGALVLVFIIVPFVVTYEYETVMFSQDYYDYYYYLTHTRLAPWLIGLMMGAFLLDSQNTKYNIHWAKNVSIWIIILICMGTIIFTGNEILNNFDSLKNAFYLSLHRASWSFGLCWIIFACVKEYGGIINWFLSLPMFQILARITYSMYAVHVFVVMAQLGRLRVPMYVSDYDLFYLICGDVIVTMLLATFWSLLFESPIIIIEKVIFGGGQREETSQPKTKIQT